ncbi:MAG: AMP-binding protein [Pseudomonadota bacterium]
MPGASVYLTGALPPCPDPFNAAEWCLSAEVPRDALAFLAVDAEANVLERWSFDSLRDRVLRAAGAFVAAGVEPGDRVLLQLGDVPEFPVAYLGAIAAGAVAAPLSSQLSNGEVARIVEAVAPSATVGGARSTLDPDALAEGPPGQFIPRAPNDPALLVFTSGSGGQPKGVLHAQRAFWARQSMHAGWHDIRAGDRVMHAGAFNWTYTLGVGLVDTWSVGAAAILNAGRRDPEVWPVISAAHEPTIFAAAPAVYRRLLKHGRGLHDAFAPLRHAVTAGEALSPVIAADWTRATGKPLLEALGMSEVSTYVSTPPDRIPEPGVVGWPQPGRQVAVLGPEGAPVAFDHPGVLAVHASDPGLMLGYWQDKATTDAAFAGDWFLTGDRVTMRRDGAVSYLGREDDQMNTQGYRVDPGEVETALLTCTGVVDCAVRALQVREGLSVIAGWIVPAPGEALNRDTLLAELDTRLATYKQPRELFLVEDLPRTPNGKLMRRALHASEDQRL